MRSRLGIAMLLLLVACTPLRQEVLPSERKPILKQEMVRVSDGTELPIRAWLPEDEPEAVILALHGFNDYSHAFEQAGSYLQQHGIAVYAYDQRGFGAAKQPGIWPGKDNLKRDMRDVIELVKGKYPYLPFYLMGESMGGAVVISGCAEDGCPQADGLILTAPALWGDEALNGFYKMSLWLLAHSIPSSAWTGEDLDIMASDNLEMLYAMGADPLVIKETRIDAVYGLVNLMENAFKKIVRIQQPTLVLYGAKDEVVPSYPVAQAIDRLIAPHTVGYYKEGYHMLLRDLQREVVLRDLVSWVNERYRPLPSGADMGWKEELLVVD